MKAILYIALGGALGSVARYLTTLAALSLFGPRFPWGTLAVNVVGGLLMGLVAGAFEGRAGNAELRLFLTTGILGGFTTFSAFSLETVRLYETDGALIAGAYIAASVVLSVTFLVLGMMIARHLASAS